MRGSLILLAAVLVAVGIGVAAEVPSMASATGPPWARFYAAFSAAPTNQTQHAPIKVASEEWSATGTSVDAQLIVDAVLLRPQPAGTAAAVLVGNRDSRSPVIPPQDSRTTRVVVAGQPATRFVGCLGRAPAGKDRCAGSLSLSIRGRTHRVQWVVEASGPSAGRVEQLLASFTPAEG